MRSCKPLCVVLLALPMSLAQARQPADAQALLPQSEASLPGKTMRMGLAVVSRKMQ